MSLIDGNRDTILLAGDIGGTKTRLGLFRSSNPRKPLHSVSLVSADFDSLSSLCSSFLASVDETISFASLGVPGPVIDGRAATTNLPWQIDQRRLGSVLGLESVLLFNDLVAVSRSIPLLVDTDVRTMIAGESEPHGPVAIVAPGTGLGVAYGLPGQTGYTVVASEGGHADFAPIGPLQEELLLFLRKRFGRASYERLCSGLGLPNIYEFLKASGRHDEPAWLATRLAKAEDPTPVITNAAMDPTMVCPLCTETLRVFAAVLGAKAGNEALAVVATGGVYIAGGVVPRILPALEDGVFTSAFLEKGRMKQFLEGVPVHVIVTPEAPLLGAAQLGFDAFNSQAG